MGLNEEDVSDVKRELSRLKPELQGYIHSLGSKEIIQFVTVSYQTFLRKEGVQHPDVEKLFLSLWKYLQEEIKGGLQILNAKVPGLHSFPLEWTSMEIMGWKMGRDQFYEERIDEINLQFGVDLRRAAGYETVKNLFSRKIKSLEQHLLNIQDSHEQAKRQLEHGQRVLEEGQKLIESTQRFLDSRKGLEIQSPKNENDIPSLVSRVRNIMLENDLTKKQVAASIKRHRGTLDRFLDGSATPETMAQVLKFVSQFATKQSDST